MSNSDNTKTNLPTEKNFGLTFACVFLIVGLWPLFTNEPIRLWSIISSIILVITSFTFPKILKPFNYWWFKFGLLLRSIVSRIVIPLVFYLVITPTGLLMRILGKDFLGKKIKPDISSYWINRDKKKISMKDQF
jgi:hypothetical protein